MNPGQNALVNDLLSVVETSYREEHKDRVFRIYERKMSKIAEASAKLDKRLRRLARKLAGCCSRDSVPVRIAGLNERSPRKPVQRGRRYHKYSWKHPAGFRVTEYEPSTRYVCVSIGWVNRHFKRV